MASQQQAPDAPAKPSPWHAIFPTPKAQLPSITPEALAELIRSDRVPGKDYIVVDVRRTDFEVCTAPMCRHLDPCLPSTVL